MQWEHVHDNSWIFVVMITFIIILISVPLLTSKWRRFWIEFSCTSIHHSTRSKFQTESYVYTRFYNCIQTCTVHCDTPIFWPTLNIKKILFTYRIHRSLFNSSTFQRFESDKQNLRNLVWIAHHWSLTQCGIFEFPAAVSSNNMADWRICPAEVTGATLTLESDTSCGCRPWGKGATFVDVVGLFM
jgi:hypothetical protein